MIEYSKLMNVSVDAPVEMAFAVDVYNFTPCLVGTIAGGIMGYWNNRVCAEIAWEIDSVINHDNVCNSETVSVKWLQLVTDIVEIAKVAEQKDCDPECTTVKSFLEQVRDSLAKRFAN